ncbi:TPA: hypothetical protein ACX6QE_003671 [Photobacterium damselae]
MAGRGGLRYSFFYILNPIGCTCQFFKFDRPKDSTVNIGDFLMKHFDIVTSLERGLSINQTVEIMGKGGSIVKRVKAEMK